MVKPIYDYESQCRVRQDGGAEEILQIRFTSRNHYEGVPLREFFGQAHRYVKLYLEETRPNDRLVDIMGITYLGSRVL